MSERMRPIQRLSFPLVTVIFAVAYSCSHQVRCDSKHEQYKALHIVSLLSILLILEKPLFLPQ
jgi:hypothetical protein